MPRPFASVPSEPLGVKPAREAGAEYQGAAYYEAAADGNPAALMINTTRMASRPLWEVEALALHEGVPGQHVQVARAHELARLPDTLGARFDLRRFHGAVLDDGPLPLAMLERQVEHWIKATARDPSPPLKPRSAE